MPTLLIRLSGPGFGIASGYASRLRSVDESFRSGGNRTLYSRVKLYSSRLNCSRKD